MNYVHALLIVGTMTFKSMSKNENEIKKKN